MTRPWTLLTAPEGLLVAISAAAQDQDLREGIVIQPAIPEGLSRGHTLSVDEQAGPEYMLLGIPIGGMVLSPRVEIGGRGATNTCLNRNEAVASGFLPQRGSASLNSPRSRHSLQISAATINREFIGEPKRNEHLWSANAGGHSFYSTVRGLSAEIDFDTFPTPRLTIGLTARRTIEDSVRGSLAPSINTRMGLHADYELLRNLILGGMGNYSHQPRSGDTYGASANGRYLASRRIRLRSSVSYTHRTAESVSAARAGAGIAYQL
jgi:hypothetical protein